MGDFDQGLNKYWWKLPEEKIHEEIFGIVRFLDLNQTYKDEDILQQLHAYANFESMGMAASEYSRSSSANSKRNKVTYNVIESCCDTVTSKIAKNKVRPLFVTSGGDISLMDKAQKLNKFVEGLFYETKLYDMAPKIFRDATVFGTGCLKIYRHQNKIKIDRILPNEIVVDDAESLYGEPHQMHQKKYVPREIMISQFPAMEKILRATKDQKPAQGYSSISDMLLVVESWHLPTIDDEGEAENGRHTICVENGTLLYEDYDKEWFPFVFFRWKPKLVGFWGSGIAEQLKGIQNEINRLLRTIQLSMHLCSVPRFWVDSGSRVVKSHINNEVGAIISHVGNRPVLDASNAVPPELREHLQYLIQQAYELAGISQLSATSKKPQGLDSGKALREFDDIETERFVIVGQDWERFHLECADRFIQHVRDIMLDEDSFKIKIKGKKFLETIDWKEIDLEEDEYFMQAFPTSMLSDSPSGRLADIQEMMQAGMIDPQFGMKLLGIPDLEMYTDFMTAPLDNILNLIEKLTHGEYQTPEPYQDLKLGLRLVQYAYLMYKDQGLPDTKLDLFRRWLEAANAALNPEAPAAGQSLLPEVAGSPSETPQGRSAKPPISSMLPYGLSQNGGPNAAASPPPAVAS